MTIYETDFSSKRVKIYKQLSDFPTNFKEKYKYSSCDIAAYNRTIKVLNIHKYNLIYIKTSAKLSNFQKKISIFMSFQS